MKERVRENSKEETKEKERNRRQIQWETSYGKLTQSFCLSILSKWQLSKLLILTSKKKTNKATLKQNFLISEVKTINVRVNNKQFVSVIPKLTT